MVRFEFGRTRQLKWYDLLNFCIDWYFNQISILLKKLFLRYFPNKLLYLKQGFAGFPDESGRYLGDINSYMFFKKLGIKNKKAINYENNLWKIINIEYFLRNIN